MQTQANIRSVFEEESEFCSVPKKAVSLDSKPGPPVMDQKLHLAASAGGIMASLVVYSILQVLQQFQV